MLLQKRQREPIGGLPNEKLQELIPVVFHLHNLSDSVIEIIASKGGI